MNTLVPCRLLPFAEGVKILTFVVLSTRSEGPPGSNSSSN